MIIDAKFGNSKKFGVLENKLHCRKAFLNVIIPTTLIEARHLTIPQYFKGDVPIKSPLSDIRSHLETAQMISFSLTGVCSQFIPLFQQRHFTAVYAMVKFNWLHFYQLWQPAHPEDLFLPNSAVKLNARVVFYSHLKVSDEQTFKLSSFSPKLFVPDYTSGQQV